MRLFFTTLLLSIMAMTLGCTTCGNPLGCCSMPMDGCTMGCCESNEWSECPTCGVPDGCMECQDAISSCTTCEPTCGSSFGPSCGSMSYEMVYAPSSCPNCGAHGTATQPAPSGIPTQAAPTKLNMVQQQQRQPSLEGPRPTLPPRDNSSLVTGVPAPQAPQINSIVRPPAPAAPVPEPEKIKTTKPVKNFLPSILSDET